MTHTPEPPIEKCRCGGALELRNPPEGWYVKCPQCRRMQMKDYKAPGDALKAWHDADELYRVTNVKQSPGPLGSTQYDIEYERVEQPAGEVRVITSSVCEKHGCAVTRNVCEAGVEAFSRARSEIRATDDLKSNPRMPVSLENGERASDSALTAPLTDPLASSKEQPDEKPRVTNEWLRHRIAKDPDGDIEAGLPLSARRSDEWSRLEAARDAAAAAMIKLLGTHLGQKWVFKEDEFIGTYYKTHEATQMAWEVFYALYPFLRQPERGTGLRPLDEETIIHFLTEHAKYLHNPLTGNERALIGDIVRLLCPLTRLKSLPPAGMGVAG